MTLDHLKPGEGGTITVVGGQGALRRRLLDLDVSLRGAKRRGNLGKAVAARTSHCRPHAVL